MASASPGPPTEPRNEEDPTFVPEPSYDFRKVDETFRRALEEPGLGWKDWFYQRFLKVWIPLAFFIVDVWIVISWLPLQGTVLSAPVLVLVMIASLVAAIYLELMAFQFLWYDPDASFSHSTRGEVTRWALRPGAYGRWTERGMAARGATGRPAPVEAAPDPDEFL